MGARAPQKSTLTVRREVGRAQGYAQVREARGVGAVGSCGGVRAEPRAAKREGEAVSDRRTTRREGKRNGVLTVKEVVEQVPVARRIRRLCVRARAVVVISMGP